MRFQTGQLRHRIPRDVWKATTASWKVGKHLEYLMAQMSWDEFRLHQTEIKDTVGIPIYFAIEGRHIYIAPRPEKGGNVKLRYIPLEKEV